MNLGVDKLGTEKLENEILVKCVVVLSVLFHVLLDNIQERAVLFFYVYILVFNKGNLEIYKVVFYPGRHL